MIESNPNQVKICHGEVQDIRQLTNRTNSFFSDEYKVFIRLSTTESQTVVYELLEVFMYTTSSK